MAIPFAWNATNALYELFVVRLDLVLGLILIPVGRRFCLLVVIFVLFVSMVLDSAVAAVACVKVNFRVAAAGAAASLLVGFNFLVSLSVITGAVDSGGVCAVGVIFVGVIGLYVLALLMSSCAVDCGGVCVVFVVFVGFIDLYCLALLVVITVVSLSTEGVGVGFGLASSSLSNVVIMPASLSSISCSSPLTILNDSR